MSWSLFNQSPLDDLNLSHRKRDGNRTDSEVATLFNSMVGFQNGLEADGEYEELGRILKANNVTLTELKNAISPTCTR